MQFSNGIKRSICLILVVIMGLVFSGCGAMFTGTKHAMSIDSTKVVADVYIDGKFVGKTPLKLTGISRKSDHTIELKAAGYKDISYTLRRQANGGAIAGDVLTVLLGLIPIAISFGVDGGTGAMFHFKEGILEVHMVRAGDNAPSSVIARDKKGNCIKSVAQSCDGVAKMQLAPATSK